MEQIVILAALWKAKTLIVSQKAMRLMEGLTQVDFRGQTNYAYSVLVSVPDRRRLFLETLA